MLKLIVISTMVVLAARAEHFNHPPKAFIDAINGYLSNKAEGFHSAILIAELPDEFSKEHTGGSIKREKWEFLNQEKLVKISDSLLKQSIRWTPSNVSALAEKGECLIIFLDSESRALVGLIHRNRWKDDQYQVAFVRGDLKKGFSLDGFFVMTMYDRNRDPMRDVPYVLNVEK